jgi:hypothetical protein
MEYTREQLTQIISTMTFDFSLLQYGKWENKLRRNQEQYEAFSCSYPNVCRNIQEFMYLSRNYQNPDFVSKLFCTCGTRLNINPRTREYNIFCSSKCTWNSTETRNKVENTNLERYGSKSSMQNKKVREKASKTLTEKYGTLCPCTQGEALDKAKKTRLLKYGVEQIMQNSVIKSQVQKTNKHKYGDICPVNQPELKHRAQETLFSNYGTLNPMQSEIVVSKHVQTIQDKYGVPYVSQINMSKEVFALLHNPQELKNFIEKAECKTGTYLAKALGVDRSTFFDYVDKYSYRNLLDAYTSSYEIEIKNRIAGDFAKTRRIIPPYEIDLYSEEHKFGIEFNGNYWHSDKSIPQYYHQKKSLYAETKGIFIYHIFEYEWLDPVKQEKILSQLQNLMHNNSLKLYARKCKVQEISALQAKVFLEENHMQGSDVSALRYGLFYESSLVSVMTFSKPRFTKKYQWELSRYCVLRGASIVGGSSKLFKHFQKCNKPKSVISYSHIAKTTGLMYAKLGFSLSHITDPDYVWIKSDQVLSRYQCQKHKLLAQGHRGSSEREIMEKQGYLRVFSCGNKVWVFQNS